MFECRFRLAPVTSFEQTATASGTPAYLNPALPVSERVNDLVSRMTLEEKTSQRCTASLAPGLRPCFPSPSASPLLSMFH
jgi:hypothetical protein